MDEGEQVARSDSLTYMRVNVVEDDDAWARLQHKSSEAHHALTSDQKIWRLEVTVAEVKAIAADSEQRETRGAEGSSPGRLPAFYGVQVLYSHRTIEA